MSTHVAPGPCARHCLTGRIEIDLPRHVRSHVDFFFCVCGVCGHSQHSTGMEAACNDSTLPLGWGMCTLNTTRTRVFFLPMSVSPFRSSMSELRSFRMPAQSMLRGGGETLCFIFSQAPGWKSFFFFLSEGWGAIKPTTSPGGDWK